MCDRRGAPGQTECILIDTNGIQGTVAAHRRYGRRVMCSGSQAARVALVHNTLHLIAANRASQNPERARTQHRALPVLCAHPTHGMPPKSEASSPGHRAAGGARHVEPIIMDIRRQRAEVMVSLKSLRKELKKETQARNLMLCLFFGSATRSLRRNGSVLLARRTASILG